MKTSATFTLSIPIETKKEDKHFTSWCPVLEICSHGKTKELAEEYLRKIIQEFLTYCYERGALDKVLKDCGFTPSKNPLSKNQKSPLNEIDVPLPFTIDRQLARCHH